MYVAACTGSGRKRYDWFLFVSSASQTNKVYKIIDKNTDECNGKRIETKGVNKTHVFALGLENTFLCICICMHIAHETITIKDAVNNNRVCFSVMGWYGWHKSDFIFSRFSCQTWPSLITLFVWFYSHFHSLYKHCLVVAGCCGSSFFFYFLLFCGFFPTMKRFNFVFIRKTANYPWNFVLNTLKFPSGFFLSAQISFQKDIWHFSITTGRQHDFELEIKPKNIIYIRRNLSNTIREGHQKSNSNNSANCACDVIVVWQMSLSEPPEQQQQQFDGKPTSRLFVPHICHFNFILLLNTYGIIFFALLCEIYNSILVLVVYDNSCEKVWAALHPKCDVRIFVLVSILSFVVLILFVFYLKCNKWHMRIDAHAYAS